MKSKDFMINDWVKWTFDIEPKHRQIFSIITEENADGSKECYADLGDGEIYKDLFPIPLTPEILVKNGFNRHGCVSENKQYQVLIQHWSEDNIALNKVGKHGNPVFIPDLIYVHELQHALRLCGLNELADNFQI